MAPTPISLVARMLSILEHDRAARLLRIDNYLHGKHDLPYMPDMADAEFELLAERSVCNWVPNIVGSATQVLYVDGFRRGRTTGADAPTLADNAPEWEHFQRSRLDSRQVAIHHGAVAYGHSFVLTTRDKAQGNRAVSKGLSPLRTAALYEDPANDIVPYAAITIDLWPDKDEDGEGRYWDGTWERVFRWKNGKDEKPRFVGKPKRHGASSCPITRFACAVDLEGRTLGLVEPMIELNNLINQTVFDLLLAQTYGSIQVRTITGMAPPLVRDQETGEPVLDDEGQPIPLPVNMNSRRFLFAEDPDVEFSQLPGAPLDGYVKALEAAVRRLAAITQTPPHHILGEITNLAAEALEAAEVSLARRNEQIRKMLGESWERVFQVAAELDGIESSATDFSGEVIWRDMDGKSLSKTADALGKLRQLLEIPAKGLWRRVPGVTQTELGEWDDLKAQEPDVALAATLAPSSRPRTTSIPAEPAA